MLFVFASNLAGIFVAASFDAIRLLSFHESCRQVTASVTSATSVNSDSDQQSSQLFSLNFNRPLFGQQQQDEEEGSCLSPSLQVVGGTASQPASDDTYCRRRLCRTSASAMTDRQHNSKYSTTGIAFGVAKSLMRGLRASATATGRVVYVPIMRGLGTLGKRMGGVLSSLRGGTTDLERPGRGAVRRATKCNLEGGTVIRSQQQEEQNRRGGVESMERSVTNSN
ncbi:unnamed protein product, partial [Hydatigera taeniaeformis]